MRKCLLLIVVLGTVVVATRVLPAAEVAGPLKAYVDKPDDSYGWAKRREGKIGPTEYVELTLTSQTWQKIVWRHQLFILKPSTLRPGVPHALLHIGGGNWRDELAQPPKEDLIPHQARSFAMLAETMKTPVAVLLHVPQQPIFGGLVEDQIISLTFEQFLRSRDPEKLLLLPMVKSAVRAMDTVQKYAADRWSVALKTFTVTGASKRGWTTWLTGAVDRRATALAPMVIDVLNMGPQMRHQVDAWGDYSYKIRDYTERDLPKYLDSPSGKALRAIVDPYSYRKQLTQPKLILIGTNDHYWPLDALNLYWNDLAGRNYVLYVPNNRHGLSDRTRVIGGINALHQHAATGQPLPKLSWKFDVGDKKATLTIDSDVKPETVRVWAAASPTRDFRRAKWRSQPARLVDGAYIGAPSMPPTGYVAMFGEAVYTTDTIPYYLSTNVRIVKIE